MWCVDESVASRAVDKEAKQAKIADSSLGFTSRPIAVICVDRGQAVDASGMARGEFRHMIVDRLDGVVRHESIGHLISPMQTASVFYLLAFGMIVRWRTTMYRQFRALVPASR